MIKHPKTFPCMKYLAIILLALFITSCSAQDDNTYENLTTLKVIDGDEVGSMVKEKQYTAVYFWATWCGPCRTTLKKSIQPMMDSLKRDDFQVLVVAISKKPELTQKIIDQAGITQTTYVVNDYSFDNALGDKMKMNKIIKRISGVSFQNKVPVVLMMDKSGKVYGDTYSMYDVSRFLRGEFNTQNTN